MSDVNAGQIEPTEPAEDGDENEPNESPVPLPEPEPEPEPEAMSEAEMERAMKALDKENTRHANRISEIMGEDAQALEPCPLCIPNMTGFVFPDAIPDDQREAALALLTGASASDYAADPLTEACDVCNATGRTSTGSKVLEHLTRPCPKCIGMGFVDPTRAAQWEGEQALRNPPAAPTPIVPQYVAPANGTPDVDAWGRPRGHWLYGRDPRYLTDGERASDLPTVQAV